MLSQQLNFEIAIRILPTIIDAEVVGIFESCKLAIEVRFLFPSYTVALESTLSYEGVLKKIE